MHYKCEKCGEFDDAFEWNTVTKENMGPNIVEIQDINFSNYREEYNCFTCPNCYETCYVEDGHVKEIEV